MNPDVWLEEYYSGEFFSGNFDHLKEIISKLNLMPKDSKVITVAGTNGKGQTSRFIAKIFLDENKSTLLLTSPHLKKVNERFQINGHDIEDTELLDIFSELKEETKNIKLSYFEFLYLSFLKIACKMKPYVLIQEVGLGGRLDATNAIDNDVSVLTSISRDHQEILGHKYRDILREKLGILRRHKKLISCLELSYLRKRTFLEVSRKEIEWVDLFDSGIVSKESHFSKRNEQLGLKVFEVLEEKKPKLSLLALKTTSRGQIFLRGASCELFPTHNVDGLRKLIHFLASEQYNNYDLVLFAPSKRSLKDLEVMGRILINTFSKEKVLLVGFKHVKALGFRELSQLKVELQLESIDDIKEFQNIQKGNSILVLGSNYFLGELYS